MGHDKAELRFGDATLLERTVRTALVVAPRVLVVGRSQPENWLLSQAEFLPDETPGLGPLGALQTALRKEEAVLVLACDLPLLTPYALRWLIEQGGMSSALHGVIVENGEQWEPLFSIYHRACLPLIEANLAKGRRSMHALIRAGEFSCVPAPPEVAATLINVNTQEEWAAMTSRMSC